MAKLNPLIGLIPADGIGKEVIPCAQRVIARLLPNATFVTLDAGYDHFRLAKTALPQNTLDVMRKCDGGLFGSVSSPSFRVAGYSSPIVQLRKSLDLYANVRPVSSTTGKIPIDLLIVRENTECLYIKQEKLEKDNRGLKVAYATRQISEFASTRIAKLAYSLASKRNKKQLTIVHKSNVLSVSDGLFRECCLEVSKDFPDIETNEQLVDSMVYRLFREPQYFDTIVAPNLYGDIISDGAAALVGSLGVVGSVNLGDNFCIGEPVHGSAPDIVGKGIANPIASIRSAAMLLEWMGHIEESKRIFRACDFVIEMGKNHVTPDLGGTATTEMVTLAVISKL